MTPRATRAGHSENYSGRRRRSGLTVQIASTRDGTLLGVSRPFPGSTHDRRAFAERGWEQLLADASIIADPAYQGTTTITPRKKPHGGELSGNDKATDKGISRIRSAAERRIAHLKNWKILATGYRGRLDELPAVISIVSSLEFYRLGW